MLQQLNKKELKELVRASSRPAISIFLPTYKKGKAKEKQHIYFKNLIKKAIGDLLLAGWRRPDAENLFKEAGELLGKKPFWEHQQKGLAVYISPGFSRYYQLPFRLKEELIIDEHFHITPLLKLLNSGQSFYLLALSKKKPVLYRGDPYALQEIKVPGLPQGIKDTLKYDQKEEALQYHTKTPGGRPGKRSAVFHGQAAGTDKGEHKQEAGRYCREIAKVIQKHLHNDHTPLVLKGVEYLTSIYRKTNRYPALVPKAAPGNPDQENPRELLQEILPLVEPLFATTLQKAKKEYFNKKESSLTSNSTGRILAAARQGRVKHFFISALHSTQADRLPGTDDTAAVPEAEKAALWTFIKDGNIFILPPDKMPESSLAAAVLRY